MSYYGEKEKAILQTAERVVFEQIEQVTANNDINNQELELLYKLIDIIKDIKEACVMDESGGEYNRDYYSYNDGSYGRGNPRMNMSYNGWGYPYDGMSFNQGYNQSYNQGMNSQRNGRGGGYSRHDGNSHLMAELQKVMNEATSEKERNAIMRCMNELE